MGKTRISDPIVRNRDVKVALADAYIRAVHWAPESLLRQMEGERRSYACRRLAVRVVEELAGDGWRERRPKLGEETLEEVVVAGMSRAGEAVLATLPAIRLCNGRALDGIGRHLGEATFKAMQRREMVIEKAPVRA